MTTLTQRANLGAVGCGAVRPGGLAAELTEDDLLDLITEAIASKELSLDAFESDLRELGITQVGAAAHASRLGVSGALTSTACLSLYSAVPA